MLLFSENRLPLSKYFETMLPHIMLYKHITVQLHIIYPALMSFSSFVIGSLTTDDVTFTDESATTFMVRINLLLLQQFAVCGLNCATVGLSLLPPFCQKYCSRENTSRKHPFLFS